MQTLIVCRQKKKTVVFLLIVIRLSFFFYFSASNFLSISSYRLISSLIWSFIMFSNCSMASCTESAIMSSDSTLRNLDVYGNRSGSLTSCVKIKIVSSS